MIQSTWTFLSNIYGVDCGSFFGIVPFTFVPLNKPLLSNSEKFGNLNVSFFGVNLSRRGEGGGGGEKE